MRCGICSRVLARSIHTRRFAVRFQQQRLGLTRVLTKRILVPEFRTRLNSSPLGADQTTAGEWLMLAFPDNQGFKDESDPALVEALNEVSSMTLAALLKEDEEEIITIQDELYRLGEFFSKQGNKEAALFMFVLYKMSNHQIPKVVKALSGIYLTAYQKIGGLLEDSGWELKMEDSENQNEDSEE
eukprot:g3021.t1